MKYERKSFHHKCRLILGRNGIKVASKWYLVEARRVEEHETVEFLPDLWIVRYNKRIGIFKLAPPGLLGISVPRTRVH